MTTKIAVYNQALAHLGERKLASLTEAREPRYKLDDQWTAAIRLCLERVLLNSSLRTVLIDASTSIEPAFGMRYAFPKPEDWIRTLTVSDSDSLSLFEGWQDEGGYWYADIDQLYVQFVSDHAEYGGDLGNWPETFAEYVAVCLARRVAPGLTASVEKQDYLFKLEKRFRVDARGMDAMNQPVSRPPSGTWVRSRSTGAVVQPHPARSIT